MLPQSLLLLFFQFFHEAFDPKLVLQAKSHGHAGYGEAKAGAEAKKEGSKAESDARKEAAKSEYHAQK